ncbi:hypothetical protein BJ742DRAFT_767964 [Cladochytrium replicatum]|nr:hypothetical protein BJ742DRAFT_767964 [Cladochytrium replicatum]
MSSAYLQTAAPSKLAASSRVKESRQSQLWPTASLELERTSLNLYDYTVLENAKLCRERTDNLALTLAASCSPDDYLGDVLVKMNESNVHRIWIADPATKILGGVVALKDIIAEASQCA